MYKREKADTRYLYETDVENLFINEYMPDAPSDYVKVYLLALMYAQSGVDASDREIAEVLRLDGSEIDAAWTYWEDVGAVSRDGGDIVFTSMREQLYGIGKDAAGSINAESRDTGAPGPAADAADQKERSRLFTFIEKMTGKALGYRDIQEINSWLDDFGAAPETVKQAYRYCRERGTFNTRYVGTIVLDWTGRHLDTAEKVEKYLEENDMRRSALKRVMSYLGFSREPTEKERQLMDYWLDELNCSIDEILDACSKTSGISNPNFNYLDAVLRGKRGGGKNGAGLSRAQVFRYYEKMREEEENEAAARTEEVYGRVPEIREIDKKILELNSDLLTAAINGGADLEAGRERIAELDRKREALLTKNDIPVDYMKPRRRCAICGDTGQKEDGSLCSCFAAVAAEAAGASEA